MWRGKLRWIFRGCGRAVKFPPMLWNMGRELYNRNAISSRDDLYSHRSTSGSSSRRRSKFVGKFFINLPLKELSINYTGYIKGPSLRDW